MKQNQFPSCYPSCFPHPHCHHWELLTQCHLICHPNGSPHCEMHQRLRLRSRHNSKFTLNHPTSIASQTHGRLQTMFFFYFLFLTLKTNIFKTQSTFPGNWIVKKVATAVNGFFIHVVSKLCIFCVKLSKNQSIKRQKYNKIFLTGQPRRRISFSEMTLNDCILACR